MQVLQPTQELLQFCDSASNVCTTSSRQSDSAQQNGSDRPSSTADNAVSKMTLKDSLFRRGTEGSACSTMQSHHQRDDDWRYRPEHRVPNGFWQEARDFLVEVAVKQ